VTVTVARTGRRIIGIAGAPGAGKTAYAARLVAESPVPAVQVPMDGFHLADSALVALGLRDRKGAPETFDAWGYAALLGRVRSATETVWAPGFERGLEQPLAGVIAVPPDVELVVTEGNYLLLDRPEWRAVRAELDEVWSSTSPTTYAVPGWWPGTSSSGSRRTPRGCGSPAWTSRTPRWWRRRGSAPTAR
jgi:pantothenate kinase